ncbi:S9 family peptidase [Chryseotalea sanaruensis]|uniref:S9 family peptidase n=1 Tax=Chryseotalea sanaruensis TaxID=2482724 RepID=A0A401UEB3_9BACT|nr:prolyl oligopeptidase family serine peptidase [Chryseotalea sanaruensis]GCC53246.1 S9 family peptidase [Chryseotalea sanaruensis]
MTFYKKPEKIISSFFEEPINRKYLLSENKRWLIILEGIKFSRIEDISQPKVGLAGIEIQTKTFTRYKSTFFSNIKLIEVDSRKEFIINNLPNRIKINNVSFSPDSSKIAFQQNEPDKSILWLISINELNAYQASEYPLHTIFNNGYTWVNQNMIIYLTPLNFGKEPQNKNLIPNGPLEYNSIEGFDIRKSNKDFLKNENDEFLFEFYGMSQMMKLIDSSTSIRIYPPSIISSFSVSPDNNYILIKSLYKPFSYTTNFELFPSKIEIIDQLGKLVCELHKSKAYNKVKISYSSTTYEPRDHGWRSDKPATIFWIRAKDSNNQDLQTIDQDHIFNLDAPFNTEAEKIASLPLRFGGIYWGNQDISIVYEWWWETKKLQIYHLNPQTGDKKTMDFIRPFENSTIELGKPLTIQNNLGQKVLLFDEDNFVYFICKTVLNQVEFSILQKISLKNDSSEIIWKSNENYKENFIDFIDIENNEILVSRESNYEYPNLFIINIVTGQEKNLTNYQNLHKNFDKIKNQVLRYKRSDGVSLSAEIFLPETFRIGDPPLPTLIWAYPKEYKDKSSAENKSQSWNKYFKINWDSHYPLALKGYAIIINASFPVLGDSDNEPNDSFIEQITMNAKSLVEYANNCGYIDPNRIAIGGHSYGAFLAANLMVHTKLFKACIAISGAYNRSLTPFGFQNENRTYWKAQEVYQKLSPFNYVNLLSGKILLMHGELDNNPGTPTLQSERFYQAIIANNGEARLVIFPNEGHTFHSQESILHMMWEIEQLLETL